MEDDDAITRGRSAGKKRTLSASKDAGQLNDTFPDRVQTTTSLTVSGPTVVRKGLSEHSGRPRNDGRV